MHLYPEIYIPENLYLIGTVNMDETTFPFSKKVLDRANTIEFSYVDLVPDFEEVQDAEACEVTNDFLKSEYIVLKKDVDVEDQNFVIKICSQLQSINEILQEANSHVGYRVRDEIVFYMLNNKRVDYWKKMKQWITKLCKRFFRVFREAEYLLKNC